MPVGSILARIVTWVFGIVEVLLGLRFLLKLLGANPAAGFVQWVNETSAQLLRPFFGVFPAPQLEGRFVIEFSTLFAILVYGLIALAINALIDALTPDVAVVEEEPAPKKTVRRRAAR